MNNQKQTRKPVTPEERRDQVLAYLTQKREQYAHGILLSLCQSEAYRGLNTTEAGDALVDLSVHMADRLLEKLFPMEAGK